jgi:hypothetical protein
MNAITQKTPMKLKLALAISAVLMSGLANAESWDITQTVTPGSATTCFKTAPPARLYRP